MGVLDWLMRIGKGGRSDDLAPPEFDREEEDFHGLNMKSAIEAHLAWKARLEATLEADAGASLDLGRVAADCHCTLGQWLHGEAKRRFSTCAEYDALVKSHALFHLTAGEILRDARAGQPTRAKEKLRTTFRACSDTVQLDLVRLYAVSR